MTPERKKYYYRISKEEQAIRGLLISLRYELHQRKRLLNIKGQKAENDEHFLGCLHSIKAIKFQIKTLKRQLPMPLKHHLDYSICRCGMHYERADVAGMFYCKRCGQAIRPASW